MTRRVGFWAVTIAAIGLILIMCSAAVYAGAPNYSRYERDGRGNGPEVLILRCDTSSLSSQSNLVLMNSTLDADGVERRVYRCVGP